MKSTKRSLLTSGAALLLCFVMLIGTTFAWFTDEATSANNVIKAGNLDIEMHWSKDNTNWKDAEGTFAEPVFNYDKWEPGYTEVRYIKVTNNGSLSFKYEMFINPTGTVGKLAEVIDVSYDIVTGNSNFKAPASKSDMGSLTKVGTLNNLIASDKAIGGGVLLPNGVTEPGYYTGEIVVCVAFHMQELAGNEYQGTSIGDSFGINLYATQFDYENDSFDNTYDDDAAWPYRGNGYQAIQSISNKIDAATGTLSQSVTVGDTDGQVYADVPNGIKLADGANTLTLTVEGLTTSNSGISATHRSQVVRSVDVHIDGVAEDNTVAMIISLKALLPTGLNSNNVNLYHVEDGQTIEMTLVSDPVNHNEFSYDPATGDVVMALASFSEIATFAETEADWNGTSIDDTWFDENKYESTSTFTISNAEQFVYFRDLVDEGYTFEGKTVNLDNDIYLGGHNFDPIGWGYVNSAWNRDTKAGKAFQGTFNGGGHTIYGLRQDGWDLETETGTDYTYTNCGGGLFAAAYNATFTDLEINGANIRFECVEIGVLVGLAQGNCNFNNITISGCKIANYQRPAGGVVGEVSPKIENGNAVESTHSFNNVHVDANTVVGSLWGDFDAPVGGVIGAYWDDEGKTSVYMEDVNVACRLDVYNDVTSTYQWYAYRRAGMLIGNSDQASGHTATATYLTCKDVIVYYGEWADYHYCEFNKANPNWPWVRVEPGENCSGYSNPRWGRPIDPVTGNPVTDSVHDHGTGEGHLESIPFHQLYGGGQGVYGEETHPGVSEGIYSVSYIDRDKILHVDYVTNNKEAYTDIWNEYKAADGSTPSYWVTPDNKEFKGVDAGHTADVVVYPKWPNEYTIRCLDTYGNAVYYNFAIDDKTTDAEYQKMADDINSILTDIQNEVDKDKKVMIIVWQEVGSNTSFTSVTADNIKSAVKSGNDFILEATPQLQNTSITLEKYFDPTTGELVAYHVVDVNESDSNKKVVIPDYVGKIPVTQISDGAAKEFDNLYSVEIPNTVTYIGNNAFPGDWIGRETITIYTYIDQDTFKTWLEENDAGNYTHLAENWDQYLGDGSRIFFLDENGKVDPEAGYWESYKSGGFIGIGTKWLWGYHAHEYSHGSHPGSCGTKVSGEQDSYFDSDRPDTEYWTNN